jgi:hypothetical protein
MTDMCILAQEQLRVLCRPLQGIPETVTVSREADGWYACSSCADVPSVPAPCSGRESAIAVDLTVLLITADEALIDNSRSSRTAERALRTAQRRVSGGRDSCAVHQPGLQWGVA